MAELYDNNLGDDDATKLKEIKEIKEAIRTDKGYGKRNMIYVNDKKYPMEEVAKYLAMKTSSPGWENPSSFAGKKSIMAGFLDLSLFIANVVKLRDTLDTPNKEWYIWVNAVLLILILLVQIALSIILACLYNIKLYDWPLNETTNSARYHAIRTNIAAVVLSLVITILHIISVSIYYKEAQ